ncbi:hypothetical protein DFH28DRAFT_1123662 [Melampsora americana]|nr:hypothetical protein DFH28DRAFT_1123662 [Melampsora americana]
MNSYSITLILAFIAASTFAYPMSMKDSMTNELIQRSINPNDEFESLHQSTKLSKRWMDWGGSPMDDKFGKDGKKEDDDD